MNVNQVGSQKHDSLFKEDGKKNTFPIVIQWERHGGYLFKNKFYSVSSSNNSTCA